jgi:hypothetical protein
MNATALPAQDQRIVHRRPGSTRAAKRRAAVIAELIADLGRQPDASEWHLIATIADLTVQREALAGAQLRGEPVDAMAMLKIAALIARMISALRGKSGSRLTQRKGSTVTVQTDIDTTMATLKTAIAAYTASAGNQVVLASWLVSQIKQSDPGVARALDNSALRMVGNAPETRSFATVG